MRRFSDGGINVVELLETFERNSPPKPEDEQEGLPRVLLQHILIEGTSVDLEDLARPEPLKWVFGPTRFELNQISTLPDRPGDHEFVIGLLGVLLAARRG